LGTKIFKIIPTKQYGDVGSPHNLSLRKLG